MGRYIQTGTPNDKAARIMSEHGAEKLDEAPAEFADIPEGKALVVVCHNGPFDAAAYIDSAEEFDCFLNNAEDTRHKTFLLLDKEVVEALC